MRASAPEGYERNPLSYMVPIEKEKESNRMFESGEGFHFKLSDTINPYKYRIPQEALDIMSTYEESADYLRDTSQEMTDIANYNRNLAEVRGMGGLGADISQAESNVMGRAVSIGGASTSSMGIASELRSQSISSMRDAAIQAQASRQQKEEEYKNTVLSQGGAEIAASEMEIKGKQEMLRQREQEFQINVLDPYYFKQQKELIELSKQPESGGLSFLNPKNW